MPLSNLSGLIPPQAGIFSI